MKHSRMNPRPLASGMGEAVARRTVLRQFNLDGSPRTPTDIKQNKSFIWENWGQVAERVAKGNCSLDNDVTSKEEETLIDHIANASILMSGRSLQHGDLSQKFRNKEVFTNCATAATSFLNYYLLLNGSGVGRCYDDDLMVVDWSKMPFIHPVLDEKHPDFDSKSMESVSQAYHKYGRRVTTFTVQDSREGWGHMVEYIERLAYEGTHTDEIVLVDFSPVREKDTLIKGMQNRPSSGPVPLMTALNKIATLKGANIPIWRQNLYVDHYFAESVLVGGARRSARIAVKHWRDPGILDFIAIKKDKINGFPPLWSANNSVGVDDEFWKEVYVKGSWARTVFDAVCEANYYHDTGEPGFLNLHKIKTNNENFNKTYDKNVFGGSKIFPITHCHDLMSHLCKIVKTKKHYMIVNPCGEITLNILGGYCVIGDVVPYFCDNMDEVEEAVRATTRALIRLNKMDCVYYAESNRTNRIGVGLTGIHEWAWAMFGYGFRDLVDENKSKRFWEALERLSWAVKDEAHVYATSLGMTVPHTDCTIKPSGSVSKLFGLSEGAHLPSMKEYLRWVQFRYDDPLVSKYANRGYVTRNLQTYEGVTIVGFPTQPEICKLSMGDQLVTAGEATFEEQYQWIKLLEKYWLGSGQRIDTGNQISYTMKYKHSEITFERFKKLILENQPDIKCCSIMPQMKDTAFEYQPEQPVTLNEYNQMVEKITEEVTEDVDKVHVDCANGACPIDFTKEGQ